MKMFRIGQSAAKSPIQEKRSTTNALASVYCSSEWEMGGCFSIGYTLYTNTKVLDIVWSLQKCRAVSKETGRV
nr:MAG TPA: hypothetical protein [Caudoviricetes sp.]